MATRGARPKLQHIQVRRGGLAAKLPSSGSARGKRLNVSPVGSAPNQGTGGGGGGRGKG
jgi:hypothetical protein